MTGNVEPLEMGDFAQNFLSRKAEPPREVHLDKENKCYVFSNKFEKNGRTKELFEIDEKTITDTFGRLNFKVKIKSNLTEQALRSFVDKLKRKDLRKNQCIVVIILSHGENNGLFYTYDWRQIKINWIVEELQDVYALSGKPKMVFANFCRGETTVDTAVYVEESGYQKAGVKRMVERAKKADTLVYYATSEGNVAFADRTRGSYFVMALCKVMQEYFLNDQPCRRRYHLNDVMTRVNDFVSTFIKRYKVREEGVMKEKTYVQMCEACSTLTQNVFFHKKPLEQ